MRRSTWLGPACCSAILLGGCSSSDDSSGVGGTDTADDAGECVAGYAGCPCTPEGLCLQGYACVADVCEVDDSGDGDGDGDGEDTVPPTIVSVSPDDGDSGVLDDATIVVTFSEPMDPAATEGAFISSDIPMVGYAWNTAGDELTITPSASLVYATGMSRDSVTARAYGFSITTAATDLAGNPLSSDYVVSFTTARDITESLSFNPALTGSQTSIGEITMFPQCQIGDDVFDRWNRCGLTFDLSPLVYETIEVYAAQLVVRHGNSHSDNSFPAGSGLDPYDDLGPNVNLVELVYDELTGNALSPPGLPLGVLSDNVMAGPRTLDVTTTAQKVWGKERRAGKCQFGIRFDLPTNGDGLPDFVLFDLTTADAPTLEISYLVP